MPEPKIKEKRWNSDLEKPVYEKWKKDKTYKFDKKDTKKVYSIDTPPPYVNTPVHIGQATTYVLMDMFARYKRMKGHNVLFPLGLDRNGLPIEMAVEKKFGIRLNDVPREEFVKKCNLVLEESSLASTTSFQRLGISFNSWDLGNNIGDVYETDSKEYRTLTQETFIDMWHKGLIYEDERINNFCPGCQTTIADAEIDYEDLPTTFNDIIFKCKETGEDLIIGTTRPELACTCGMVIFNPKDDRYKHLNGKTAISPIFNKEVPIMEHPLAEMDKGTGLVMMCSAGDTSDIRFFREMNLNPLIAINKDGTMNEHAGLLKGLKVKEARAKMIEELEKKNLLVNQMQTTHRTPICERSKDPIEFIQMKEFYVRQIEYKSQMKKLAKKMNFFAPESKQIMLDWIDTVNIDWPISRRRYYATEIPLWYCKDCNEVIVPPKGKYYQPWKDKPPVKECPNCKGKEFKGEVRVFDTWFDSSISPLYILKYSRDDAFFKKNSPCSLRPQGKEIIRTWLYYTVLKDFHLTGKCVFNDVWINYHIVDEHGKKMSKSKGNIIDPREVLDKFGAEPFRLWSAIEGNLEKTDFRCSFERIEGASKTLNKLWNVARFISMFPETKGTVKLTELDNWILAELNELVKITNERYDKYDFHNPGIQIKHFIWETFASHYLELVKNRAYNQEGLFNQSEQNGALQTLNHCLDTILKLLAPVIPMMSYKIHKDLTGKDIHFEEFPKPSKKKSKVSITKDEIVNLNSEIWKTKKDNNLNLKSEIAEITVPKKFKLIEKDFKAMHNIKKINYGNKVEIKL
jgi:valyl-tRNA synthetase